MIRGNQAYWLRAVSLWFLLMAAETLHGLWRVKVLAPWIGDEFAHEVAVFTGSLIILLITFAYIDWIPAHDARTLLSVGSTWAVLTVGYEFVLGRLAFDRSWNEIASDFDLFHGRLLLLGLLFLLFAPLLAAWLRGSVGTAGRQAAGRQV